MQKTKIPPNIRFLELISAARKTGEYWPRHPRNRENNEPNHDPSIVRKFYDKIFRNSYVFPNKLNGITYEALLKIRVRGIFFRRPLKSRAGKLWPYFPVGPKDPSPLQFLPCPTILFCR